MILITFLSIIGAITLVMGLAFIVLIYFTNDPHDSRKPRIIPDPDPEVVGDGARPTDSELRNAPWQKVSM